MKSKKISPNTARVAVIIPVYNTAKYLQQCLDSLCAQTFQDFEIIAVNDGSTDNSLDILNQNAEKHPNITIIDQENHGQGYARNRVLDRIKNEYVLFVDADDYTEPELIEKTVATADDIRADVVHFNWKMLVQDKSGTEEIRYFSREPFAGSELLEGQACERFLEKNNYFAWDGLYRKSFLDKHAIRFGEGYIYEDNEFIAKIASYAEKIAILDEPLYVMRHNVGSSTRTQHSTNRHYQDFMRAMERSFEVLQPRSKYSSFYLSAYFLEKFIVYYQQRVPKAYRRQYLRDFVDILHMQNVSPPSGTSYRFLRSCIRQKVFLNQKYDLFYLGILYKTKALPLKDRVSARLRKLQHN